MTRWQEWAAGRIGAVRDAGQWRAPREFDGLDHTGVIVANGEPDRKVVSFASNDYLGLTNHPAVIAAAHDALDRWGAGAGSARLIVGSRPVHAELEAEIASWKGVARAALFPTGFTTNLGVITALADADTLVCSDELNHASIIDGCRMARAEAAIYRHSDLKELADAMARAGGRKLLVVTDTVFSMDGDLAPVDDIATLCADREALLVLDEAHAVLGPDTASLPGDIVRTGTLSKTLGALGGFVAADRDLVDCVINTSRPYIFTTASTPADAAAGLAALRVLRSAEGDRLVARLRTLVSRVRPGHLAPIVPVVCGAEQAALDAAAALLDAGLLVPAIRPPTVPAGTSRLRITLSAAHTDDQVEHLLTTLDRLGLGA